MNPKTRLEKLALITLATLLSAVLLSLALPRFKASYRFLPVDLALDAYYQEREIPSHRLLTLISFARQAIGHHDHYRYRDSLSLLYYLRAIDLHTPGRERRDDYRASEAEAVETVRQAPAQPEAWLRVARVRSILHDEPESIIEPWKMSIFTGRTHSTLMVPRVGIGLAYFEYLDAESRSMLRDQLLLAWDVKPAELVAELAIRDPTLDKVRSLAGIADPTAVAAMEARLEKIR
jgi:hypothetical protein